MKPEYKVATKVGLRAAIMTTLICCLLFAGPAAAFPNSITYQGRLTGNGGKSIPAGTYGMKFELFSSAIGSTALASWTFLAVYVDSNGTFRVDLDGTASGKNIGSIISMNKDVYLEISIQSSGGLETLKPRAKIGASARAQHSYFAENGAPVGAILPFGGTIVPEGWLLCNGLTYDRKKYATLFSIIGSSYGSGDGTTTFHVPDLRGRFIRGVDSAAKRDIDAATRTAMNSGGNTGDKVGSVQAFSTALPTSKFVTSTAGSHSHPVSAAGNHSHTFSAKQTKPGVTSGGAIMGTYEWIYPGTISVSTSGNHSHSMSAAGNHSHSISGGDKETRPVNANVNFIIKY